jgi:glycosyltransferase involved in cell wall biosynthesis
MTSPLVSIIIPCYNGEKTIKNTIFSVLMDPYPNFEIVVVDDGSTDGSVSLVTALSKMDQRIHLFKQQNKGVSAARNHGAKVAKGQYLGFLDADDLYLKNSLFERMGVLLNEPSPYLMGVYCPAILLDINRQTISKNLMFNYNLPDGRMFFLHTPHSVFNPSCAIIKRFHFERVGGFDETLVCGSEDYDLWHRMLRTGGYFQQIQSCNIGWTQHASSRVHAKVVSHFKECKKVTEKIFSQDADSAPEFVGGFGSGLLQQAITQRAIDTAVGVAATGDIESALEISQDVNKTMLEMISSNVLYENLRRRTLRSLCYKDNLWPIVWQQVRMPVLTFLSKLQTRLGNDCKTLENLQNHLNGIESSIGYNVICLGDFESTQQYESFINKIFPLLPYIGRIYFPIPSDDYCGRATVQVSRLLNISLSPDMDVKESKIFCTMTVFPQKNVELWNGYLSEASAFIRFGNIQTEIIHNYLHSISGYSDVVDLDNCKELRHD